MRVERITQDHYNILSKFPQNLSLEQAEDFAKKIVVPALQKRVFIDKELQYRNLSPKMSETLGKFYIIIRHDPFDIIPDFDLFHCRQIDGICRPCGNLTPSGRCYLDFRQSHFVNRNQ